MNPACFRELIAGTLSLGSRDDFQFPQSLTQEEVGWARVKPRPVEPLGYYHLGNVAVCGAGFPLQEGRLSYAPSIIPAYLREILEADPQRARGPLQLPARKLTQPALLFAIHDYNNYMHWWMELAPRIYPLWLRQRALFKELAVVIPADLSQWCRDTLSTLYEIEEPALVAHDTRSEVLHCAKAVVPSMPHTDFHLHPAVEGFYRYVIDKCAERRPGVGLSGRLFLSRRQSARGRVLANILDVEELAASLGFEVIAPETLPWQDQVCLFAGAKIVAGEHGAAMKNLLFAPDNAVSIVINYVNPSQATLAALKRQRCMIVGVEGTTRGVGGPFVADIRKLRVCLEHGLRMAGC